MGGHTVSVLGMIIQGGFSMHDEYLAIHNSYISYKGSISYIRREFFYGGQKWQ